MGVTLTDPLNPRPLPMLKIDEPTLTMNFCVNTSPLAGREGKFVTSRQIWDRLQKELRSNVALRVKETDEDGIFEVSGRGELHLTILLEEMRREGYELAVSKPRVVYRDVDGVRHEPIELVTADIEEGHQGGVMQALRSEEHTSELQSPCNLVCRLLLEKKKKHTTHDDSHAISPELPHRRLVRRS